MFECRRCRNVFPDDTESCPVCGTVNRKLFKKKTGPIRLLINISDYIVLIMSFVNLIICVTCSHYCQIYDYGIFAIREAYWIVYPALIAIDVVFALITIAIPIISVVARKKMMRRQRAGVKIIISLYAALFASGVLYPFATYFATLILSPILFLAMTIYTVFLVAAIVTSILLLSQDVFCF